MTEPKSAPLIRWAGSKKRSLSQLLDCSPKAYTKYIEAFAGSACFFFALKPERSVINDSNKDLISFYRSARSRPHQIYRTFTSLDRNRQVYHQVREALPVTKNKSLRAAYFYYLNRNCFNGIYRTNTCGKFNVPFSDSRVPPYPDEATFRASCRALKETTLECLDFEEACLRHIEPGAFIYLDPPYYVPATRVFREYSATPFQELDFYRLQKLLFRIDSLGAFFMLSYPDCALSRSLASDWRHQTLKVQRSIAGSSTFRGSQNELIVYNYKN